MKKFISLNPRINKRNGQINFQLKKRDLPKYFRKNLNKLKCINIEKDNFKFEENFEDKWSR